MSNSRPSSPSSSSRSPSQSRPHSSSNPPARGYAAAGATTNRRRRASSLLQALEDFSPRPGVLAATGEVVSLAPSIYDYRRGSVAGSNSGSSVSRRASTASVGGRSRSISSGVPQSPNLENSRRSPLQRQSTLPGSPAGEIPSQLDEVAEEDSHENGIAMKERKHKDEEEDEEVGSRDEYNEDEELGEDEEWVPEDKPKVPWTTATWQLLKAFWKFHWTPFGFFITWYLLNVTAWGGMLFLLLCGAGPAMGSASNINSPRKIWMEIDQQILNAFFCLTSFGLIPWRVRDCYYEYLWRVKGDQRGLQRLAGVHGSWFRLPRGMKAVGGWGSIKNLSEAESGPDPGSPDALEEAPVHEPVRTASGRMKRRRIHAPPTAAWKLDFVIQNYIWNTIFQAVLAGLMWGLNRFDRPSWSTGLFISLGFAVAIAGGVMVWLEGRRVKKVEGAKVGYHEPVSAFEREDIAEKMGEGAQGETNVQGEVRREIRENERRE